VFGEGRMRGNPYSPLSTSGEYSVSILIKFCTPPILDSHAIV